MIFESASVPSQAMKRGDTGRMRPLDEVLLGEQHDRGEGAPDPLDRVLDGEDLQLANRLAADGERLHEHRADRALGVPARGGPTTKRKSGRGGPRGGGGGGIFPPGGTPSGPAETTLKLRFFLAIEKGGPYSETSFRQRAKFFRRGNGDARGALQERCGRW